MWIGPQSYENMVGLPPCQYNRRKRRIKTVFLVNIKAARVKCPLSVRFSVRCRSYGEEDLNGLPAYTEEPREGSSSSDSD